MKKMTLLPRLLTLALAAMLVLGGCSSTGGTKDTPAPTPEATPAPTAAPEDAAPNFYKYNTYLDTLDYLYDNLGYLDSYFGVVAFQEEFAVLDGGAVTLHRARYNPDDVARAYLSSGCALAAPEMCRIILQNLRTGRYDSVSSLVRHVAAAGDPADPTVWCAADLTYPWDEPLSTPEFWEAQEERL